MQSYIELKVPIRWEEPWFEELRDLLDDVNIRWQHGYYHITMAFLDKNFGVKVGLKDFKEMSTVGDIAVKAGV